MRMRSVLFAILALLGTSLASHAGVIYTVNLDTTALVGSFGLAFQFADGTGTGDGNNVAVISDFQFGGGSPLSTQYLWGATGSLSDTVTLADSDPLGTYFAQQFTPGGTLSFLLALTTNVDDGGVFDVFTFALTDSAFFNIPTTSGASGDYPDVMLSITLDSDTPTPRTYGTDYPERTLIALNAPVWDNAVPEPATWLPVGSILGIACCLRRRWRAHRG